jgi:hypothetical protein
MLKTGVTWNKDRAQIVTYLTFLVYAAAVLLAAGVILINGTVIPSVVSSGAVIVVGMVATFLAKKYVPGIFRPGPRLAVATFGLIAFAMAYSLWMKQLGGPGLSATVAGALNLIVVICHDKTKAYEKLYITWFGAAAALSALFAFWGLDYLVGTVIFAANAFGMWNMWKTQPDNGQQYRK